MIIALSGVDGSGKTTLAREVVKEFKRKKKKTEYFYLGDYLFLSVIVKFLRFFYLFHRLPGDFSRRRSTEGGVTQSRIKPKASIFKPLLKRMKCRQDKNPFLNKGDKPPILKIWVILAIIDNLFNFLRLSFYSFLGYVVVCDRYFYDKLVGFEYHGYSTELLSKFYLKMTPSPDLLFVLDVEEKISQEREVGGQHSLAFYQRLRKKYHYLASILKAELIDNSQKTKEQTLRELLKKIDQFFKKSSSENSLFTNSL